MSKVGDKQPSSPQAHGRSWICAVALLSLAVLAYLPATRCAFIWDDDYHLTANPCIIGPLGLKEIWTSAHARICPLVLTTFWIEHHLWGLNPLPFHLVNILLHAAAALVLWRVLLRLKVPGAWLGAALWMLHPVQVESVAWITEMKNTQSGLFFLLAILFFCKSRQASSAEKKKSRSKFYYVLTLLFGGMALASKSSTVVLPLVLGLCSWWLDGRWHWRRNLIQLAPLLLLSAAAGALSIWTQNLEGAVDRQEWSLHGAQRLVVAGRALWFYLGKLLWPHPLIMVYPRWEITTTSVSAWLPLIAALLVSGVLWRQRNAWNGRGRALFFSWSFFVIALLPVLGLLNHGFLAYSLVGDHFQYLASMGPLALAGAGLSTALDTLKQRHRAFKPALGALLLFPLGALTWSQCAIYQNEETLWTATLPRNPSCWVGRNNLGNARLNQGKLEEATAHFREAIAIRPNYAAAHNNLGNALQQLGRMDEALAHYRKAIDIRPNFAEAHTNLGGVLQHQGNLDESLAHHQRALEISPDLALAHNNLGVLLGQQGRTEEAMAHYQKSLEINPSFALGHYNLGSVLQQKGRMDEALARYQSAIEINPGYAEAHKNSGVVLQQKGRIEEALAHYQRAVELKGDDPQSLNNLAYLLAATRQASLRNGAKAVELAQKASQLTGGSNPIILGTLAAAQAEAGDFPSAVETIQRAIRLAETSNLTGVTAALRQHLDLYRNGQPLRDEPGK